MDSIEFQELLSATPNKFCKAIVIKLLFAIICLLGSVSANAYDFIVEGIYYNVISLSDLTCSVTTGGDKYIGGITIPKEVTYKNKTLTVIEIDSYAFQNCTALTGVTIPNSIIKIDPYTFEGCSKLEKLNIEDGTETLNFGNISASASLKKCPLTSLYLGRKLSYYFSGAGVYSYIFSGISTLRKVTIGKYVTEIAPFAFRDCSNLTNINIGNSVTDIGISAFANCSSLTSVIIPNSVAEIGISAFANCSSLASIIIPNSVTEIGEKMFYGCSSLTNVTIPSSVTKISDRAFMDCINLTSVIIPNSVTEIGINVFSNCSRLTNVAIPSSVIKIGNSVFSNCSDLTRIAIPNSVTEIGEEMCYSCSSLTNVIIPNSVTDIGDSAFSNCSNLTSITIGSSVTKIGYEVFYECPALTELYSLNPIPPSIKSFTKAQYMDMNVYVPQGSLSAYQEADEWKNFWNLQEFDPTGVETIKADGKKIKDSYYDIQGRKLNAPKKGLNIINGKKVLIKE